MSQIEIDNREVIDALRRLSDAVTDMQPAFDAIGSALVANIHLNLGSGRTPWGDAFTPLKHPRRRQGSRISGDVPLNDTRQHIYNKITHNADHDSVTVGMNDPQGIGRVHQYGSSRKNIPERPFMPIQGDQAELPSTWLDDVVDTITRHIQQGIG